MKTTFISHTTLNLKKKIITTAAEKNKNWSNEPLNVQLLIMFEAMYVYEVQKIF